MLKKLCLTGLALTALLPAVYGQDELTNNQPVRGQMNQDAARIQAKMTDAYNKGLIDQDQLAQYQRDFDAILDKEDALKSRSKGMTEAGKKTILKKLAFFEAGLDKQCSLNNDGSGKKKSTDAK